MSYLRKELQDLAPGLAAREIARRLKKMCIENPELCRKYLFEAP